MRVFLATGLHDIGRPDLDADDEEADLETHWVPLSDALAMVFDGTIVNSSCVAAVLAVHAVRTGAAQTRPADAPWPDRPTRFAARKRRRREGSRAVVRGAAGGREGRWGGRRG